MVHYRTVAQSSASTSRRDTMTAKTKTVARKVVARKRFNALARITFTNKGKVNPRRKGTGPYKRYETLRKAGTVGMFLKKHPKWHSTIVRAVREGFVRVAA